MHHQATDIAAVNHLTGGEVFGYVVKHEVFDFLGVGGEEPFDKFLVFRNREDTNGVSKTEGYYLSSMVGDELVSEFTTFKLVYLSFADNFVGEGIVKPTALRNDMFNLVGGSE